MSLNIDGLSLSINGRTILDQVDLRWGTANGSV